jgi:hypothetical protein
MIYLIDFYLLQLFYFAFSDAGCTPTPGTCPTASMCAPSDPLDDDATKCDAKLQTLKDCNFYTFKDGDKACNFFSECSVLDATTCTDCNSAPKTCEYFLKSSRCRALVD